MKKNFFLVFLTCIFLLFLFVRSAHAQTSCNPIGSSNYDTCCSGAAWDANHAACQYYAFHDANGCSVVQSSNYPACCLYDVAAAINRQECDLYSSQNPLPGTVGSGTITTGTINGGSTTTTSSTSPRTGSSDLASCSAIKFTSLLDILIWIRCIILVVFIPLIFTAAFLFFLWGVLRFMAASDSTKKEEAKRRIIWGLVALFVMVSVWGIIKILTTTLGIDSESAVPILQTKYLKK